MTYTINKIYTYLHIIIQYIQYYNFHYVTIYHTVLYYGVILYYTN